MDTTGLDKDIFCGGDSTWVCKVDGVDLVGLARSLKGNPGFVWLDSATSENGAWSYLCSDPVDTVTAAPGRTSQAIETVRSWLVTTQCTDRTRNRVGFWGGIVGYLSYDAAFDLIPDLVSRHRFDGPTAEFALYDTFIAFNHNDDQAFIRSRGLETPTSKPDGDVAERKILRLIEILSTTRPAVSPGEPLDWKPLTSRASHIARVSAAQDYILEGDIYQANLAQAFMASTYNVADPFDLYLQMRDANPAPHGAWLDLGERQIASTSPERLISLSSAGLAEARPIKGTIPRSTNPVADAKLQKTLLNSEKDRAENIMIVDLLRNDLSKVCEPGTIEVPGLCELETYAGLHHLTSSVVGTLRSNFDAVDLLCALFPGGSITGAPKHRSVEVIDELEACARGAFCGSLGYIGFDGAMDFNILIRTVEFLNENATLMAGGGITLLSDPNDEYGETLLKGERLLVRSRNREAAA